MKKKKKPKKKTPKIPKPKGRPGNLLTKADNPTRTKKTKAAVEALIAAIVSGCTMVEAVKRIGVSIWTIYDWREKDEQFAAELDKAFVVRCASTLRPIAEARAVNGVKEPVFYQGVECGTITKYDNRLLTYLMEHDDKTYRQNVNVQGTITINRAEELKEARARLDSKAS